MKTRMAMTSQAYPFTAEVPSPLWYAKQNNVTIASNMPIQLTPLTLSFRNNTLSSMVTIGDKDTIGKMMYAGPCLRASKRISCPPAPRNPTAIPSQTVFFLTSNFQCMLCNATIAQGTILKAQTTYTNVLGKSYFLTGISENAPQIPQVTVVTKA